MSQRKKNKAFLEDERLHYPKNLYGENIKPYATARKAWLFADTPKSATANAVLYIIVESPFNNHPELIDKDSCTQILFCIYANFTQIDSSFHIDSRGFTRF